jgi:hypothetical protein
MPDDDSWPLPTHSGKWRQRTKQKGTIVNRITGIIIVVLVVFVGSFGAVAQAQDWHDPAYREEANFYLGQILTLSQMFGAAMSYGLDASADAATSETAKVDLASSWTVFEIIQTVHATLSPPEGFAEIHRLFGQAIAAVADIAAICKLGIMNLVGSIIDSCTAGINESTEYLSQATVLINAMADEIT